MALDPSLLLFLLPLIHLRIPHKHAGLPASPGAAVGQAVFSAEDAEAWRSSGLPVVLVSRRQGL